jgi:DNA (cytosine-5)-methyltransferase 1
MLKLAELFCGTGAFSLAFHLEAPKTVIPIFATDKSKASKKIYDANFSKINLTLCDIHDINTADIPHMDILTAGFPCQPFSIAGQKQGFNDKRADVFWKMMDIIEHHLPKCVILENVKNILRHNNGDTLKQITSALENIGYTVHVKLINTCSFTHIPQNRERVFFVCFLNDKREFIWPENGTRQMCAVSEFLEKDVSAEFHYSSSSHIWEILQQNVLETDIVYQYRRTHVRANKSNVCPTLTANMDTGGHNVPIIKEKDYIRKLTPR